MTAKTIKLSFTAPVHFGRGRLSDTASTCDAATLFSALYLEALKMGIEQEVLDAARSGALTLSDAFPYIGETYYVPKPVLAEDDRLSEETKDSRARKARKKLAFIPAKEMQAYLNGPFDALEALEKYKLGVSHVATKVNLTRDYKPEADPYQVGSFTFSAGAGLYFVVEGEYDLEPVLQLLQYAGLGGKRTSGYGRFEYEIVSQSPFAGLVGQKPSSQIKLLLSTALPTQTELTDEVLKGAHYQLVRKGGFVQSTTHSTTPQKKRDLYLFAAGSTFAQAFQGDIYDVNDTRGAHPVYRYARAMWAEV